MAKLEKYENLIEHGIELMGGKDNVSFFTHCMTRLRFNLKDKGLVNFEELEKQSGVVGAQWVGEQLQLIIGQNVSDVYAAICKKNDLNMEKAVEENKEGTKEKINGKKILNLCIDYISGSLGPAIPVLTGCGMIKVLLLLLQQFGVDTTTATMQLLNFVGDAGYYFLPIIVGANAAKKLGANQGLGMVIGAMLIYPTFVSEVAAGTAFDFLGIPVYGATYTSTIFPVLLCVAVMAPVQKFFGKISPAILRSIIEPLCTLLVMIPISFCVLAPAGSYLGSYLSAAVLGIYNTIGFVGVALLAAFFPFIIMTGMHGAFVPYLLEMLGGVGYEPIFFPALFISNINQGVAALAVAVKTKNQNLKSTGFSCAVTGIVAGVTEPAMYGVNLKYKTPMIGSMIGSAVGGLIAGLCNVAIYAFASVSSIAGLPCYIGESSRNLIFMIVAILIGAAVTFAATFVLYKDHE